MAVRSPVRAAMVCQVMAHYREGVHRELDGRDGLDLTFASDTDGSHYSLATMDAALLERHVRLHNVYLGRATWQRGVMRLVLFGDFDAYVFTGDASVLSTWVGSLVARLRGRRVLFWTIGWHRPDHGVKSLFRVTFYKLAHRLLIYGNHGRALGIEAGYPADRMSVIYNSVTGTTVVPAAAGVPQAARDETRIRLGAIARLTERKRFDLLVEAAALLRERGHEVEVVLAGEGPATPEVRALADARNVPLELLGAVYDPGEISDFYESLDVTVIPTFAGLSIIQSLAHGVPVVTDDDADNQGPEWEAITPSTGATYVRGDLPALVDAVEIVASAGRADPVATSRRCLDEVAERWTPSRHADRIAEALELEASQKQGTR